MSFLTYSGDELPTPERLPDRVYGRIDAFEPPDEAFNWLPTLTFDSLDADWFDAVGSEIRWLGAPETLDEADRRISAVVGPAERLGGPRPWFPTDEGEWYELVFAPGDDVDYFFNLFAAPVLRGLQSIVRVNPGTADRLNEVTSLDDVGRASEEEISAALSAAAAADAVAVYDVGHGNCNALIEGKKVTLYFDFGGGVLRNSFTFPAALKNFCMCAEPTIVLSHWDSDHWSSGKRDTRAQKRTWIVPYQKKLGPTHLVFVGQIYASGRVLVWPAGLASVTAGAVTIERCTGPASSRNDSGLAAIVEGVEDGARMLLPADCGYDHVPSAATGPYVSLTVPHHGGRAPSTTIPTSAGRSSGRCVYSTGAGNTYKHPYRHVELAHAGLFAAERRTEHRTNPPGLGHVHMYWDASDPPADPACGGLSCELTCHQR